MTTVNNSYSIPLEEVNKLQDFLEGFEKHAERPNMTEIIRAGISVIIEEKKPEDVSRILNKIGRRRPGRPRKNQHLVKSEEVVDAIDFSEITDSQWEKIKYLFEGEQEARLILSESLFEYQNNYKRNLSKKYQTNKLKRWRRLSKWQEQGKWKQVYQLLRPADAAHLPEWDRTFLNTYLAKRKTAIEK